MSRQSRNMATTPGVAPLAEMVRRRREHLDLAQTDLASRGGPQVSTVSKVERGAQDRYNARTQRQIEKALGWGERTVKFLLGDGVPPDLGDEIWQPFLVSLVSGDPPLLAPAVEAENEGWGRPLTEDDYRRVGRQVQQARLELGLSADDIRALGGPSQSVLRDIESGKPGNYRLTTTWPLERALGWSPGSFTGALRYSLQPTVVFKPNYALLRGRGLTDVSDEDLLREVERRLKQGGTEDGNADAEKSALEEARATISTESVIEAASFPRAARRRTTPSTPTPDLDAQQLAGEENQAES